MDHGKVKRLPRISVGICCFSSAIADLVGFVPRTFSLFKYKPV